MLSAKMVERVARAICEADGEPWDEIAETINEPSDFGYSREWYRRLASAAIAAMQE